MRLFHQTSLKQRLLLISTAVTLMTLVIAASVFVSYDVHTLRGQMVRDLEVLSEVVGDNCVSALVFDAPDTAEKILAGLRREYQIRYAILYDKAGRRFAQYQRDAEQVLRDPEGTAPGVRLDASLLGPGTVDVVRELVFDNRPIGRILIHAGMDELAAQLQRYAWLMGLLFILTLVVSLLLALRLQHQVSGPILRLAAKTREISEGGNYSLRVTEPEFDDEIAVLFRGFNSMLEKIEGRDRQLRQVRGHLEEANANLRKLAMEISLVGEREKKRLAGELHDSPMQKLALAQTQIASAMRRRDKESYVLLEVGYELVRDALQELRTLQFELSPPVLHKEGLVPALNWLASNVTQRFGLELSVGPAQSLRPIDPDLGIVLFQCARELIHNVVKHAEASRASIELAASDEEIVLKVSDNGKGIKAAKAVARGDGREGYGLFSVRDHLSLLGGELSIESDASGTCAVVRVPMAASDGRSAGDRQ